MRVPALAIVRGPRRGRSRLRFCIATLGTDYLPPLDEGAFILDYITPPQSTLAGHARAARENQAVLTSTPEVAAFSRRTGTQLGFFLTESNRGDMSVRLKQDRSRDIDEVMDSIRARILDDGTRRPRRVFADIAGHDRRSFRHSGTGRGQSLWPRPGDDRDHRAPGSRTDARNPWSGRRLRRNRSSASRSRRWSSIRFRRRATDSAPTISASR